MGMYNKYGERERPTSAGFAIAVASNEAMGIAKEQEKEIRADKKIKAIKAINGLRLGEEYGLCYLDPKTKEVSYVTGVTLLEVTSDGRAHVQSLVPEEGKSDPYYLEAQAFMGAKKNYDERFKFSEENPNL